MIKKFNRKYKYFLLLWITIFIKYSSGLLNGLNQFGYNHYQQQYPQNFQDYYYQQYLATSVFHSNNNNKFSEFNLNEQRANLDYPEKFNFTADIELENTPIVFPIRNKKIIKNSFDETTTLIESSTPEISYDYFLPYPKINNNNGAFENFQNNYYEKNEPRTRPAAVFPGTIWCGPGNKAPSENSLGLFYRTDICCRDHDKCPDTIPPNETKNGLHNKGIFTKSHCDCDRDFYFCLRDANTFVSYKVGFAYFNLLRPQCFREEHPIIECTEWYLKKCVNYAVDESKEKVWQWFDNRMF